MIFTEKKPRTEQYRRYILTLTYKHGIYVIFSIQAQKATRLE